jgi:hypothetical protein
MAKQHSRFEGVIPLSVFGIEAEGTAAVASMIIGRGGSNIKRLTTAVPGGHIRLFNTEQGVDASCNVRGCDAVLVTGRSGEDVKRLAGLIKQDVLSFIDPIKESSKPRVVVICPEEATGSVIKKGGKGLKWIEECAGDDCFIVHEYDKKHFVVTANTEAAVQRGKIGIESAIHKYEDEKAIHMRQQKDADEQSDSSNGFCILGDEMAEVVEESISEKALSHYSPHSDHMAKQLMREEMSRWQYDDGTLIHPDYFVYDTDGTERVLSGVEAVPWYAVEEELEAREEEEYCRRVREQALQNTRGVSDTDWC